MWGPFNDSRTIERDSWMKVRSMLVTSLAVALVAGCGVSTINSNPDTGSPAVPAAQKPAAKVGDTITLTGADANGEKKLKISVTVRRVIKKASSEYSQTVKPGDKRYALVLVLKNVGTAVYDDSPENGATVIDDSDQQHQATIADIKEGRGFDAGAKLAPGARRVGVVVFEVPKRAKIATFQFGLNSGFADQTGEWTLS